LANPAPKHYKSDKIWREAIQRAIRRRETAEEPQALEKLADSLVAAGIAGDIGALREIGDRLDGKPVQQLNHAGDDGGPLVVGWQPTAPGS
jgi:hypothetical protein